MSKETGEHLTSAHTPRRAHDDPETPDRLVRPACASSVRCFTRKWQGRAGRAPARV